MNVQGLKKQYNEVLSLHNNAARYLDDESISIVERERRLPHFQKIVSKLNSMIWELKLNNVVVAEKEMLEGFINE